MRAVFAFVLLSASAFSQASFQVATVKPASFPSEPFFRGYAMGMACRAVEPEIEGHRVKFQPTGLCNLIRAAYGVPHENIEGLPAALTAREEANFFEIVGQGEPGAALTPEIVREMLRSLLAERFGLKLRREKKERPVYALTVRDATKLSTGPLSTCIEGRPRIEQRGTGFGACEPRYSMPQLAEHLSYYTDRAVVDRTGLDGNYAFWLMWSPEDRENAPDAAPGLFTAIQEIGLRLETARDAAEILVIQEVHRPSAN